MGRDGKGIMGSVLVADRDREEADEEEEEGRRSDHPLMLLGSCCKCGSYDERERDVWRVVEPSSSGARKGREGKEDSKWAERGSSSSSEGSSVKSQVGFGSFMAASSVSRVE
jgi:hypothetical protein